MEELEFAKEAAVEAGKIIRSYYEKDYRISYKEPQKIGSKYRPNPVTDADFKSNEAIKRILIGAFPDYGWLSEETKDSEERLGKKRIWVVDPLDGTKEFTKGIPEFAVSIGLVEGDIPIMGVIYNPITDELLWAYKGNGAFCNNRRLQRSKRSQIQYIRLAVSRSEHEEGLTDKFTPFVGRMIPAGSCAYKILLLVQNKADLYVGQHPVSEWDHCAGNVILRESVNGILLDLDGNEIKYNQKNVRTRRGIIAGNEILVRDMLQRMSIL